MHSSWIHFPSLLQLELVIRLSPRTFHVNGRDGGHFLVWPIKTSIFRPFIPRIWKKNKQQVGRIQGFPVTRWSTATFNHCWPTLHCWPLTWVRNKLPNVLTHWDLGVALLQQLAFSYPNKYTYLSFTHRSKLFLLQSLSTHSCRINHPLHCVPKALIMYIYYLLLSNLSNELPEGRYCFIHLRVLNCIHSRYSVNV